MGKGVEARRLSGHVHEEEGDAELVGLGVTVKGTRRGGGGRIRWLRDLDVELNMLLFSKSWGDI